MAVLRLGVVIQGVFSLTHADFVKIFTLIKIMHSMIYLGIYIKKWYNSFIPQNKQARLMGYDYKASYF